jgi:hypothetical protein
MGWSQEDLIDIFKTVKETASEIDHKNLSKKEIASAIRSRLKFRLGYRYYSRVHKAFMGYRADKKFRTFAKKKYHYIGLPAKENKMLDDMIESVADSLARNESSLNNLDVIVNGARSFISRATIINRDCDVITAELSKISKSLEKCQEDITI